MPIYEYQCDACDHKMEKLRKMSDEPFVDCPACNKPALTKLVSAAAFRLKGNGWYETDFKTGAKKNVLHAADSSKSSDGGTANSGAANSGAAASGSSKSSSSSSDS